MGETRGRFAADFPDFLAGTSSKIELYDYQYYQTVMEHFKSNLQPSKAMITIGYGFRDKKINEYIETFF